jgi:CMP/dCMP kinase
MNKIIVAIDGHSSCGKSTMAKKLAADTGYTYVDTGAMYRAVTLYCIRKGYFSVNGINTNALMADIGNLVISFGKESNGKQYTMLNGENVEREIRGMEVSEKVSYISTIGFVREAMVSAQRKFGTKRGIVMDGRDIGTIVYPDAELKIFVTASAEIRAKRRFDEMVEKGDSPIFEEILKNVQQRDYIDSHREISPLKKADDALLLDNSYMTIEQQNKWLMDAFIKVTEQKNECRD